MEIDRPAYRANAGDRCFHCRTELFDVLGRIARSRGSRRSPTGRSSTIWETIVPGWTAAREMGVLAPLLDANIYKARCEDIGKSVQYCIFNDKPSNACLASRIPIGHEVTPERLQEVARAEAALRRARIPAVSRSTPRRDRANRAREGRGRTPGGSAHPSRGDPIREGRPGSGSSRWTSRSTARRPNGAGALLDRAPSRERPVAPDDTSANAMPRQPAERPAVSALRCDCPQARRRSAPAGIPPPRPRCG